MDEQAEHELRKQILLFLKEIKELIRQRKYYVKPHHKNVQALIDYGITKNQREEFLISLSLTDYSSGPHEDNLKSGMYWIFGTFIDDQEVYIKIKIQTDAFGNDIGVCFSFHPPERPMSYPFRNKN